jgi:hypothetical protein
MDPDLPGMPGRQQTGNRRPKKTSNGSQMKTEKEGKRFKTKEKRKNIKRLNTKILCIRLINEHCNL